VSIHAISYRIFQHPCHFLHTDPHLRYARVTLSVLGRYPLPVAGRAPGAGVLEVGGRTRARGGGEREGRSGEERFEGEGRKERTEWVVGGQT
jgi:hypothetical protein